MKFNVICVDDFNTNLILNERYKAKNYGSKYVIFDFHGKKYGLYGFFPKNKFKHISDFRQERIKKLL